MKQSVPFTSSAWWSGQWPGVASARISSEPERTTSPSANVSSIGTPASFVSALPTTGTP